MNVLLIEDDAPFAKAVMAFLKSKGYFASLADSLANAQAHLPCGPWDAILLDRQLPDGDGLQLLPAIRKFAPKVPIVVLTARDKISDRVTGLDAGADDYLVKPFAPEELVARLRAIERRLYGGESAKVKLGELEIDLSGMVATKNAQALNLTAKEWALLQVLASRKDRIHSKEALIAALYGMDDDATVNRLEVHICNIRRKIGPEYLETIRGVGYRLHAQQA